MRKSGWVFLFSIGLILIVSSGCAAQVTVSTATPVPSPTRRPPPATWTPGDPPTPITPTPTLPTTFVPALGVKVLTGLPPSWTPEAILSVTPPPFIVPTLDPYNLTLTVAITPTLYLTDLPTPTQEGTSQPPRAQQHVTFPANCTLYAVLPTLTDQIMSYGSSALLSWVKTPQADHYHLWVMQPDGKFIYNVDTTQSSLTIPVAVFNGRGTYAWELVAYSGDQQVCVHLTGVFIVR